MPTTDAEITADEAETLVGEYVRFYTDDGKQTITVKQVEYPYVSGSSRLTDAIEVDLRRVHRLEIFSVSTSRTILAVIFVAALVGGVIVFMVAANSGTGGPPIFPDDG